jgi:hypothetical protein
MKSDNPSDRNASLYAIKRTSRGGSTNKGKPELDPQTPGFVIELRINVHRKSPICQQKGSSRRPLYPRKEEKLPRLNRCIIFSRFRLRVSASNAVIAFQHLYPSKKEKIISPNCYLFEGTRTRSAAEPTNYFHNIAVKSPRYMISYFKIWQFHGKDSTVTA